MYRHYPILGFATFALLAFPAASRAEDIKVCVVAVLATEKNATVDKRLADLAKEVQLINPKLTGFKVHRSSSEFLSIDETKTFDLADGQTVDVTVNKKKGDKNSITLTIAPPKLGAITYSCACDKFVVVATQHFTKDKEQLFIAVMAKPCMLKK